MIGVFDSGLGGLTVVKEIKKLLPNTGIIYLGDTARVPYGTRSPETIKQFAREDTDFLCSKNVSCIVVACNTVSSVALDVVKRHSTVPVFGVIDPALKAAKLRGGKVGLVGTRATVGSGAYSGVLLKRHASMLVPLIEEGFIKGDEINLFIKKYFSDFKDKTDSIILGCTHYPIIKTEIKRFLGNNIKLIDPAEEIAKVIFDFIKSNQSNNKNSKGISEDKYYLTDVNPRFLETAKMFLGFDISKQVQKVQL